PQRHTLLIDITKVLVGQTDLPNLAGQFADLVEQGYVINDDTSYLSDIKALPANVEIDVVYTFAVPPSANGQIPYQESLPDSRAFSLNVHYSFSELPMNNGYRPRLADDRVGYFVTAFQDFSDPTQRDAFVRYINRWHLEPQDEPQVDRQVDRQNPTQTLSPPKAPIVFWIENTVPTRYRDSIRDGILMWNVAFEQAGFRDAIEVRQMPDQADWDPADVRYNTIRWSPSFRSGLLGIGPSRVNPLTGEILDADIILDASSIRWMERSTEFLVQTNQSPSQALASLPYCSHGMRSLYQRWLSRSGHVRQQIESWLGDRAPSEQPFDNHLNAQWLNQQEQCYGSEASRQMAMGALSLSVLSNGVSNGVDMQTYRSQFVRDLVAHEVGHTLGLRHNFRGSTMLNPADLNDPAITQSRGLTGSVMDYLPVNLAPQGSAQGDYFPTVVGPYDRWAIEYGYKPIAASSPRGELRSLDAIAERSAEPGLSYATDEDSIDALDPEANPWDLSNDMLTYAESQMQNAKVLWERLERRYPLPGESYSELRNRFNTVFYHYFGNATNLTRYVGGRVFNRDRRAEPGGRLPFVAVPIAKQRQALDVINRYVFADNAFQFSPDLINRLAPSRWNHWGNFPEIFALDYPIYENLNFLQSLVLSDLLSGDRLGRMRDAELRTSPAELLTIPELFETLQTNIWTEVMQPDRDSVTISSLRRGLQRQHLEILIGMTLRNFAALENAVDFTDFIVALRTVDAPDDARVIARYQLNQLQAAIARTLRHHGRGMDTATRAHLEDVGDRITKALDAQIQSG
ncbi:MAG TPA: zinc-dependent metalloprotease, partial [Chroococcidiopsis sp.]